MASFPERAGRIAATAAQVAKLQGAALEGTVLEQANASLVKTGYDNWNGGTDLFTLMLEVPIATYAAIDDQREELERSIQRRVSQVVRTEIGNLITDVAISPGAEERLTPPPLGRRASGQIPHLGRLALWGAKASVSLTIARCPRAILCWCGLAVKKRVAGPAVSDLPSRRGAAGQV